MARHLKKISISFTLSYLLLDFGYGSTPCQNGYDYNNRCDPYYNVNLIQAKINSERDRVKSLVLPATENNTKAVHEVAVKANGVHRQIDLSYLDSLRIKYSNQFDGNMGLQALIDRSKYLSLKKIDNEEKPKINKVIKNKITKISEISSEQKNNNKPKYTSNKKISKQETATKEISEQNKTLNLPIIKSKIVESNVAKNRVVKNKVSESKTIEHKIAKKESNIKKSKIYIVKKGDNLIKIAKKFSLQKKKLLSLNKLDKNATIKIGQKLIMPTGTKIISKISKAKTKNKKIKKVVKSSKKRIYIVQSGDTLSLIAKKENISLTKLREFNKLSRSSKIKVGQKLTLVAPKFKKNKAQSYNFVKNIKFKKTPSLKYKRKIRVIATAYTSHRNQTDKTPFLAAWNNRIRPGMKIIAVSPDLIRKYGLTNGVKVKILGLPGYYVVRDKMNARLRNHIDIYMGVNKSRALRWGRKRIVLYW